MQDLNSATPVRLFRTDKHITLAAPMPGLAPEDISITITDDTIVIRGEDHSPGQHDMDLIVNEWTVGPYERQLTLPEKVRGDLANATYGNGVVVVSMPKADADAKPAKASFQLQPIGATRGERVAHTGQEIRPKSTTEHIQKHG
jgi:HSP20 family protein